MSKSVPATVVEVVRPDRTLHHNIRYTNTIRALFSSGSF